MIHVRSIGIALKLARGLAAGIVPAAIILAPAVVQAADQGSRKITTRAVAESLKKAQDAMAKKNWDGALVEIKKAQAVAKKTPFEAYQIDEFLGYVLIQQRKYGEAAPVFERVLNSGMLPAEQVNDRTKTVAQLYFQVKDYGKAAQWSRRWLEKNPGDQEMSVLLAQSYYLLKDYKNAAATMSGVVARAERAGRTPQENWLQIVMSSRFNLDDRDGIGEALKKLVRYHPKDEYWANLLDIYRRKADGDRVTLGYYRLMNDVGALKDKGDYVEMAQLAIDAGVPGEAQLVVEKGVEQGTLKSADKTEQGRYERLLNSAKKLASDDQASLAQLSREAEKATGGQPSVALGQAYLSYGRYQDAITSLSSGIAKGGLLDADEAQISLGIAYMKVGKKDLARKAFQAVKDASKWEQLAELWTLRTYASA